MKKIMLAAPSSGAGKTTITMGLLSALQKRGYRVQAYKVGPDYVDTEYHSQITGQPARNLDMFLVREPANLRYLFEKSACQSQLAVIEGVMGLFDGFGVDKDACSSSGVAKQLDCPVVLVVDGKAASTSVAALVKGFLEFDPALKICGVIINRVASENHYQLIKKAIETYTEAEVLGCLYRNANFQIPARQLGLKPAMEQTQVAEMAAKIAEELEKTLDVDRLLAVAGTFDVAFKERTYPQYPELTVAYAFDEAFHFYYQDNLDLLKSYGVQLKPFSPLNDRQLPEADGYYFGGGYPEEFAERLAENVSLRKAVYEKFQANTPILAECGGLMYLGETLETATGSYPMVGIFQGTSRMTQGLKRFGYCYGEFLVDSLLGQRGQKLYGHEFHHSIFETQETPVLRMQKVRDGETVAEWAGGYQKRQTFASYLHVHFYQRTNFLASFLQKLIKERGV